jgi:MoaA/NifB/PqqE/SkfB family radical SAM enzyme
MAKKNTSSSPISRIKCFLLDHGYTNQTSGPCCQIDDFKNLYDENGRKLVTNWQQLQQHERYIEIRSHMQSGQWHESCSQCRDAEQKGLESMRINHYRLYDSPAEKKGLMNLTIWTGRECNLQCRTCHPYCSTSWANEFAVLPGRLKEMRFQPADADAAKRYSEYQTEDFSHVTEVVLTGGEPLYNREIFPILDQIGDQTQGRCVLSIITNSTIAMDFATFPFLRKFKQISILASIDATGPAFEFIRTGGRWSRVESNLRSYVTNGIECTYHITHSALNLFNVAATREWLESLGFNDCGLQTFVQAPQHLTYSIFTDQEKQRYQDWYDRQNFDPKHRYVPKTLWAAKFSDDLRSRFFNYMAHTKTYHGMDWQDHLPDLYNLMTQ